MLSPEEARVRLDALGDREWRAKAEARADELPGKVRETARTFLIPIPAYFVGEGSIDHFRARQRAAVAWLDQAPEADRAALMGALHPGLGPLLDRWWTEDHERPYQRGWARNGFRAPAFPGMSAWARGIDLTVLVTVAGPYASAEPGWLAAWGGHLATERIETFGWTSAPAALGRFLATAIDVGGSPGQEILRTLIDVADGTDPVGVMGQHVIAALLGASRPEGWERVERMLLDAELQDGLRQAICEEAHSGHSAAFGRMLDTVLGQDLLRFDSVVRVAGTWLGFNPGIGVSCLEERLRKLADFRGSQEARSAALGSGDPWDTWIALCAGAQHDLAVTVPEVGRLVRSAAPDVRAAALRYASTAGMWFGTEMAVTGLDDEDPRVASLTLSLLGAGELRQPGVFEAIGRLAGRLPKKAGEEAGLGVEWSPVIVSQATAAGQLVHALGDRPYADLAPWLPVMNLRERAEMAAVLTGAIPHPSHDPASLTHADRQFLVSLLDDRSKRVRIPVERFLRAAGVLPPEAEPTGGEDILAGIERGRTRPAVPRQLSGQLRVTWDPERAQGILEALDGIADRHQDTVVTVATWQGTRKMRFGDLWAQGWPHQFPGGWNMELPLTEVFRSWWQERPDRGDDTSDALGAYRTASATGPAAASSGGLGHPKTVQRVAKELAVEHATGSVIDDMLDEWETALAAVAEAPEDTTPRPFGLGPDAPAPPGSRTSAKPSDLLNALLLSRGDLFTPAQLGRWYQLERWWVTQPSKWARHSDRWLLFAAHAAGEATDDDVAHELIEKGDSHFYYNRFTAHRRTAEAERHPAAAAVARRLRERLLAVELRRGDPPTATSHVVLNTGGVTGCALVADLLGKLGKTPLTRGDHKWGGVSTGKKDVFSHLVRVSHPAPGESGRDLKAAAAAAGVPDNRLVDLALYAPQWAALVEEALGWPGLADGVLWLHAHTRDNRWRMADELRDEWAALAAERTPLAAQDLLDGAADVAWFRRAHAALGPERWAVVHKSARHAARGNGHRRAQRYAEAMLGQLDVGELAARITGQRDQDAVRALGLVPLPEDPAACRETARERYQMLREFERGSKAFGQLRQTSERTAVRIGVENLARTAGYPDPLRFTWAVEAQEAGDLARGAIVVTKEDVTLTLSVDADADGVPALTVARGNRTLKSVPAALRTDPDVEALQARRSALAKQAARVRRSLEEAMIARDRFTPEDFAELGGHPVVAPMLAGLVWVDDDGRTRLLGDDPVPGPEGQTAGGALRIAHPVDLVTEETWVTWQERLFAGERRQPFKQVFRELYRLTADESEDGSYSRRYDGHETGSRQALALFGQRGWLVTHESRDAVRTFHSHGLVARASFTSDPFGVLEAPSIDGVWFTRRGEYKGLPLESVPAVVFSEAMRDLDLVVSVAHADGADPEATGSTVEIRAALLRETARLMKLDNIAFPGGRHVVITGRLGEYSLHLGSGTVHRRPGGALCIIPAGARRRGRLFLPFADDDPKTAEIVSKALLLARDHEIKDPAILEQLHA